MTRTPDARPTVERKIGLALGGGGAKGLSHIVALEAFEALRVRPAAIAGTSIGAIIGAAYAAGYSPAALRAHVLRIFRDRPDVMARLFKARVGKIADLFSGALGNPVLLDGEKILAEFWPPAMPEFFEDLRIPFTAVATDFYGRSEAVFSSGRLRPAIAASMAVPGLVRPVTIDGRVHIDGAAVNPLPFDRLAVPCDLIIAVDIVGSPDLPPSLRQPTPLEATLGASQILQFAVSVAKLKSAPGEVRVIEPAVNGFAALDFFAAKRVLLASEPIRDQIIELISADRRNAVMAATQP
jgi:NTE family protein